jgi:hypothetical protein
MLDDVELEKRLQTMLSRVAIGANLIGATRVINAPERFGQYCLERSAARDERFKISWNGSVRFFSEHFEQAQRLGSVARLVEARGVKVQGKQAWTLDLALISKFGMPDDPDAKDIAELNGYPQFPFALDVDGNRIPLLRPVYPRPARQGKPHPHGRTRWPAQPEQQAALPPPPPYARGLKTPAAPAPKPLEPKASAPFPPPQSALDDYRKANAAPTLTKQRTMTPLLADLLERQARGPQNPRPNWAVPTYGNNPSDPPEKITGADNGQ